MREYPPASDHTIVRMNVDTLYSLAWLDLSKEPMVLSLPDTHGRYYLMPMLDAWTNIFASPGKRTTGTKAGNFAITGPGGAGKLPVGVTQIKAPTNWEKYYKSRWNRAVLWSDARMLGSMYRVNADKYPQRV